MKFTVALLVTIVLVVGVTSLSIPRRDSENQDVEIETEEIDNSKCSHKKYHKHQPIND